MCASRRLTDSPPCESPEGTFALAVVGSILLVGMIPVESAFADEDGAHRGSEARRTEGNRGGAVSRWRDATPAEREAIREAGRERWERATPRDRRRFYRAATGLRRAVPEINEIERLVLLHNLFALPVNEGKAMRRRLLRIDDLDAKQRARFVEELRGIANQPESDVGRIERNVDRWKGMSESERDRYRDQMRRFRELSVEERRKLLDAWEDPERSAADREE